MDNKQQSSKDYISKVLSVGEKTELEKIAFNATALSAIKKIFLFGVYYNGVLEEDREPESNVNWALALFSQRNGLPDEHLGQFLRGKMEGIAMIEAAMAQIENFKPVIESPKEEKKNPAV